MGKMPMVPFLTATLIGATIWNTFLLFCGMKLRQNWIIVHKYSHEIDIVVVLVLAAGLGWFVWSRLAKRKARELTEPM